MKVKKKRNNHTITWIILTLFTIIIAIFITTVYFRHNYVLTSEEVVKKIANTPQYTCEVEYNIRNSKNEYLEEVELLYCDKLGLRIDFQEDRVKIYKESYIYIEEKGNKYEVDKGVDQVYPLASINNILSNKILSIEEGQQQWGDKTYIKVIVKLPLENEHIDYAYVFLDKEKQIPVLIQIYDMKNQERIRITYKKFIKIKKVDRNLF